ncbi:MAG TPA: formylglycine-generating enzyme family protein [Candidatus Bathyarchaeia archaeon]|nr:formylglycine-generating enzyme family protein [Candidatus Bathyarchaeia archaeon]
MFSTRLAWSVVLGGLFAVIFVVAGCPPQPPGGEEEMDNVMLPGDVLLEMVWIPGGTFMMGRSPDELDSSSNEDPQHEVTVPGFWMAKYELTKRQWEAVMGTEPWYGQDYVLYEPDSPAVYVTWHEAKDFVAELNAYTGRSFRLPSEAEWEYACRAGTTTRFYWGDDTDYAQIGNYAWDSENCSAEMYAHIVGQKLPNSHGLHDMSGNVWEWCADDWHSNYSGAPTDGNVWADSPRSLSRVIRGGCWDSDVAHCRSAYRQHGYSTGEGSCNGFRIATW